MLTVTAFSECRGDPASEQFSEGGRPQDASSLEHPSREFLSGGAAMDSRLSFKFLFSFRQASGIFRF